MSTEESTIRGLGWNVKVFTPPCCMYLIRVLFFACFFWYPCVSAPSVAKTSARNLSRSHTYVYTESNTPYKNTEKHNLQWHQKVGYQLDHPASVQCVPCAESYEQGRHLHQSIWPSPLPWYPNLPQLWMWPLLCCSHQHGISVQHRPHI